MAVFVVPWPYLLTNKLSCLQKNNFGHTMPLGDTAKNESLPNKFILDSVQDLNFSIGHSNLSTTEKNSFFDISLQKWGTILLHSYMWLSSDEFW